MLYDIRDRSCLVVGGGGVALRKVSLLLRAGARVRVVAVEACAGIERMASLGKVALSRRRFAASDIQGAVLVIAGTDDREVNSAVLKAGRKRGVPVNVVDDPELCDFIIPAIVESGELLIAVSSSGAGPGFTARIAAGLRKEFGPEYAKVVREISRLRARLKKEVSGQRERKKIIDRVLDGNALKLMMKGKWKEARREMDKVVAGR